MSEPDPRHEIEIAFEALLRSTEEMAALYPELSDADLVAIDTPESRFVLNCRRVLAEYQKAKP
jgi:hypothetical protein